MTRLKKKIKSVLVRTVPLPKDSARDWEDVLDRAGEGPVHERQPLMSRRGKCSRITKRLAPALALAAVIFAVLLLSPWQGWPGSSAMRKALAAIEKGPVLHVVLHNEGLSNYYFIDVASGRETLALRTSELWYDRKRDFVAINDGYEVNGTFSFDERMLITPEGAWTTYDWQEWGPASIIPPELTGFFDDYRSALVNGSAYVAGSGTANGRDVTWIAWPGRQGDCSPPKITTVNSIEGIPPTCEERVAVDKSSSLPLQLDWVHRGKILATVEIASIETLPAGSGDFSKPERKSKWSSGPISRIAPTNAGGAIEALPGALWAGESLGSLELTGISRASFGPIDRDRPVGQSTEPGIELHYGSGNSDFLWSSHSFEPRKSKTGVIITERRANPDFFQWGTPGLVPPAGSLLVDEIAGWMEKDGLVIEINATSKDLMLQAARALKPIEP